MEHQPGVQTPPSKRHKLARKVVWLIALGYALAALLPCIFVPSPPRALAATAMAETTAAYDRATIVPTGPEALDVRLNLIANAKHSLVVGTYLFANDESGLNIASALLSAADRGVRVRVLTDGLVGGGNLLGSTLGPVLGSHPNVELRFYNPVNPLSPWGLNARYHEKYVIADDAVFVLGGRNISNEFLTPPEHPAYNYDVDVLVYAEQPSSASAVTALNAYFDELWSSGSCSAQYTAVPGWQQGAADALRGDLRTRYAALCASHASAMAPADWAAHTVPIEGSVLLHNPINPSVKQPALWAELASLMRSAKQRIWIQTPYLALNSQMYADLQAAADAPSELVILTNSKASGNNVVAESDALIHRGMLTRMDAALYETQNNRSMHTKALLLDDDLSVFGSFNFDMRSAYLNTELMLVVRSKAVNQLLEEQMLAMRAESLPVLANGSYGENGGVLPKETALGKTILLYLMSPFTALMRFLI
ncbi:MAG: phosphatidylserine/phosphatidylglycerophosphate/cardiolipin synthase family protein [Clostridia bacterium]